MMNHPTKRIQPLLVEMVVVFFRPNLEQRKNRALYRGDPGFRDEVAANPAPLDADSRRSELLPPNATGRREIVQMYV
jgi:hypothetical protein